MITRQTSQQFADLNGVRLLLRMRGSSADQSGIRVRVIEQREDLRIRVTRWWLGNREPIAPRPVDAVQDYKSIQQARNELARHMPLIAASMSLVLPGLRLMIITRGDASSALALARVTSPTSIGLWLAIYFLPTSGMYYALTLAAGASSLDDQPRGQRRLRRISLVIAMTLATVCPWPITSGYALGYVGIRYVPQLLRARGRRSDPTRPSRHDQSGPILNDYLLREQEERIKAMRATLDRLRVSLDKATLTSDEQEELLSLERDLDPVLKAHQSRYEELLTVMPPLGIAPIMGIAFWAVFIATAAPMLMTTQPWTPPERVTTQSSQTYIGYVMGSDAQGWTSILLDGTRRIDLIRTSSISSREICAIGSTYGSALGLSPLAWFTRSESPEYPPCIP